MIRWQILTSLEVLFTVRLSFLLTDLRFSRASCVNVRTPYAYVADGPDGLNKFGPHMELI